MATKNACASESWPATPISSDRPIAAIIDAIANSAVCSQKLSSQIGSAASTTTTAAVTSALDTGHVLGAEEAVRPHQQHEQHHDVGGDRAEAAAEEGELLLIARGEDGDDADDQAAGDRAARRGKPSHHVRGDPREGDQPDAAGDARGGKRGQEEAAD